MKGFISHIAKFMEGAKLVPASGNVVIALSGGRDSMGLLHVAVELKNRGLLNNVRAFHVNHGTRPENAGEEKLVFEYCKKLGVPLLIFHPDLNSKANNFEHRARLKRYELFLKNLKVGEVLYTAHHIDDSFEWSLLKQFKSGSVDAHLGIPVKNGRVYRPFNCVTKRQIKEYVKLSKVPFAHDSSNESLRFERNFIRKTIIPKIAERFPGYLKHYVHRSNELALKREQSAFSKPIEFKIHQDKFGILILHPNGETDFKSAKEQIIWAIRKLSNKNRGTLQLQVDKIISAASKGKKGPLLFSGNVHGFISKGALYFINNEGLERMLGNNKKITPKDGKEFGPKVREYLGTSGHLPN
jgi:tRNA(Ile)-lysidine synthase